MMTILLTKLSFKEWTYFGGPTPLTDLLVPITLRYQDLTLRFFQTGCVVVDAFSQDWGYDNDWICPPVCLLIRVVKHMELCKARGAVILPLWKSSCLWTLFCRDGVQWNSFVMTSFAHQKNLCKWGWGGSEIRLAIINCKRRTDFAPTERPRCCGWIFSNYFFGTFRRPICMARVTQNLKADPSCHNTNVFQIGTCVNVSSTCVIAFFKVKPSRGSNNSSLL